jgi:pimeloyl-ACP methyl ester carboxylesterase
MDSRANQRLARDLADAGHRVVLLDLPGHGRSDKPRQVAAHRMDAYARHVLHLLDELGLETAAVGGTSLGADVTLQLGTAEIRTFLDEAWSTRDARRSA